MMKKNLKISSSVAIINAMKLLSKTAEKCLVVIDKNDKYLGTITDGDIRRNILKNKSINSKIADCFNKNSIFFYEKDYSKDIALKKMISKKIDFIPIINKQKKLVSFVTLQDLNKISRKKPFKKFTVVIMAGGKGSRLKPFTNILPKPLIPINDRPIIELIMNKFQSQGIKNFNVTTNYKAGIIKSYFSNLKKKYKIIFNNEKKPLGTAGSLKLIKIISKNPIFVTNCDIIINSDYNSIMRYHLENKNDFTVIAATKKYTIPYGTCEIGKDGSFKKILEKPSINYLINTGFYITNPDNIELIPDSKKYDMTTFIKDLISKKRKIGIYPILEEDWVDIGQWPEYQKAIKLY